MSSKIVKYTDLVPRMLRDLNNYSPASALFALQDAGREFCNRSEAWFEDLPSIDLVADQQYYALATDYVAEIKLIKSVRVLTSDDVTNELEGEIVPPSHYRMDLPGRLKFLTGYAPSTTVTGGLIVEVVLVPNMGTNELPEWIMSRWAEGIIGHAMNGLLRGVDLIKAATYLSDFNRKLNEAMIQSMEDPHP